MNTLRVIMIGDVVGDPGLEALESRLPGLIREHEAALVTVNGENAAGGFGLTEETLKRILAAGADVVTGGNHIWEKREFWQVMDTERRVLRPANYPAGAAGNGWLNLEKTSAQGESVSWLVINLQGRELMPLIDCPFRAFDAIANANTTSFIVVDFHAESAREKEALAFYLDGRASVMAGTHTHIQTADERVLPKGTAYITDLGMTGVKGSIIGMDPVICLERARTQVAYRMECAKGDAVIQGIMVEIDKTTRKAVSVQRIASSSGSLP